MEEVCPLGTLVIVENRLQKQCGGDTSSNIGRGDDSEGRVRPRRLTHCRVRFRRRRETDIAPVSRGLV
jgi:hypothetical protein